jgi:L-2,4-diaminobutyric acid acetyltransferase
LTISTPQASADPDPDPICADFIDLRYPTKDDASAIHRLVSQCPPLDLNSLYTYLLLAEHFSSTCVVAEAGGVPIGFVSAYAPPARPGVLFVWQVAVHGRARGMGLGQRMLHALVQRPDLAGIRYLETTVSPGNVASRRMFDGLVRDLGADVKETPLFDRAMFGGQAHDDEPLLRIGPLCTGRV